MDKVIYGAKLRIPLAVGAVKIGKPQDNGLEVMDGMVDAVVFFSNPFIGRVDFQRALPVILALPPLSAPCR